MKQEAVRKMDELGRIVLPIEMRSSMGWDTDTKISVTQQGKQLILQTDHESCFVCSSEENVQSFHGKNICKKCIDEIRK